jgi:translation initiation factor 3 subunit C
MPVETWISAQKEIDDLVRLLMKNPAYSVEENLDFEYDEAVERAPEKDGDVVRIRGSIISFIDRLDDEFTRSLQNTDPHGTEFIERLRDEKVLYTSICLSQSYFEKYSRKDALARVIMRRLEHVYYKVGGSINNENRF